MTEKFVQKILKKFQKTVENFEEKFDCSFEEHPEVDDFGDYLSVSYPSYSKSLGIMNMNKDGEWMKVKDFEDIFLRIDSIYCKWCEYSDGVLEKELKKKDKEAIFLKQVIVILGLGLAFNIVALAVNLG
jgi:hypothetical protein